MAGQQGGVWTYRQPMETSWPMAYMDLRFRVQAAESRQVGVFPENASHWGLATPAWPRLRQLGPARA